MNKYEIRINDEYTFETQADYFMTIENEILFYVNGEKNDELVCQIPCNNYQYIQKVEGLYGNGGKLLYLAKQLESQIEMCGGFFEKNEHSLKNLDAYVKLIAHIKKV